MESAALAEKLLNDLLKTTEGFQRLKKMNEELKRTQTDTSSVEPYIKENERVVKENNELHQMLMKVREENHGLHSELALKNKSFEG